MAAGAVTRELPRTGLPREGTRPAVFRRLLGTLAVVAVIAVQAFLSLRLLRTAGLASGDESLYIYSGHQEIYELFHGGGSPYYEEWVSGAPVLYPVLAAMVDQVGGLVLVRLMSLVFMLGVTWLLYATARRIFGYWPALAAIGLFTGLGISHSLGVLATYDALALLLMATAAYCAVRAADGDARWLLAVPLVLVAANAVKYASALFDPVVIGLAALMFKGQWRRIGWRVASLAAATGLLLVVVVFLAGTAYWHGILFTTLARPSGSAGAAYGWDQATPAQVFRYSWSLIGLVVVLGFSGLAVAFAVERRRGVAPAQLALLALLAVAGTLVTVENMHLHSSTSVSKHDDFGAWFTCIAAGYALARVVEVVPRWQLRIPAAIVVFAAVFWVGTQYTENGHLTAPEAAAQAFDARTYKTIASWIRTPDGLYVPGGRYLLGGLQDTQLLYSQHLNIMWWQYTDDNWIKYPIPGRGGNAAGSVHGLSCYKLAPGCMYLLGISGYQAAIRAHWFTLISMFGEHETYQDAAILATIRSDPQYVQVSVEGGEPTFVYAPAYPRLARDLHATRHLERDRHAKRHRADLINKEI
jgi:4-amino-4-deoxy-L-arabinose transferase-like glycosyltransferase